jgi:rubrerythrin
MQSEPFMTEGHQKLFSLFKLAIEMERQQQDIFRETMDICDDGELRALIEQLYEGEVQHEQLLMENYEKYRTRFVAADADLGQTIERAD